MEATYAVIDTNLITNDMINESIGNETSFRKSLNKARSILKFNVRHPNSMAGKTKYTHAEILQFLIDNSGDWEVVV